MKKESVFYVTFIAPGSFVAETWTREVTSLDPLKVEWPANAYAFTMHQRDDMVDGEDRFTGKAAQVGPTYYHPDSYIQSLDEARANPKATPMLISNMEINRWAQIIWTRWGNWPQPYEPGKQEILRSPSHD